ncbi:MAG: DUF6318 family protein [Nocardioides marinisabuli]|uniref:DUF6318 family protein n=1 Tax=Nocardioides marinisabuli TaxID=419476 RepID=UPI00321C2494
MRRHLAYAAAGAVVLALTSCGDDPEPQVADPTSTPSSSSSPTESAAAEKEPWEKKSEEGAMAFIEHWIRTFNAARASGTTEQLVEVSSPSCETCSNFVALIDRIYGDGGSLQTEGWHVVQFAEPLEDTNDSLVVPISVQQAPQTLRESANSRVQKNPGGRAGFVATVTWQSGRWNMERLDLAS